MIRDCGETARFGSVQKIILTVREPLISYKDYTLTESHLVESHLVDIMARSAERERETLDVRLLEELVSL